jgi:hypothetical protein
LAFCYWIDIPWFRTKGKLAVVLIKPSLGVPNWPVIYFINYTPTSSLALFNTVPSKAISRARHVRGAGKKNDRRTWIVIFLSPRTTPLH